MKALRMFLPLSFCLLILQSPTSAATSDMSWNATGPQPSLWLADASADSCVAECEAVRQQCKTLCGETGARAAVQTGDDPHKPEDVCLRDCEEDYRICKDSC
jgi:hypothetical protein